MIRIRTKTLAEDDQPVIHELRGLTAAEAGLDTGEGFKIITYLDSNGDWSVRIESTDFPTAGQQILYSGNWKSIDPRSGSLSEQRT